MFQFGYLIILHLFQITSGLDGKFYNQQYAYQQTVVSSAAVLGGSSPDLVNVKSLLNCQIECMTWYSTLLLHKADLFDPGVT